MELYKEEPPIDYTPPVSRRTFSQPVLHTQPRAASSHSVAKTYWFSDDDEFSRKARKWSITFFMKQGIRRKIATRRKVRTAILRSQLTSRQSKSSESLDYFFTLYMLADGWIPEERSRRWRITECKQMLNGSWEFLKWINCSFLQKFSFLLGGIWLPENVRFTSSALVETY